MLCNYMCVLCLCVCVHNLCVSNFNESNLRPSHTCVGVSDGWGCGELILISSLYGKVILYLLKKYMVKGSCGCRTLEM